MFLYGNRLSNLNPMTVDGSKTRVILSERAQAYLASLSTLRLLEPHDAWFHYTVDISDVDDTFQVCELDLY